MNRAMIESLPRRQALGSLCGCGGAAMAARLGAGAMLAGAGSAVAAAPAATGKARTAAEALELLKEGNRLFLKGELPPRIDSAQRRLEIAKSQSPFAVLVSCSDSRVPPEALFGRGLGDLFIVRVAGNTVSSEGQGSIEYAVAELGVPLVVVMGHERCGAVAAALSVVKDHTDFPGSIGEMVQPILPAAIATRDDPGDWLDNAIRRNVVNVVERLKVSGKLLQEPLASGALEIVGSRYDLDDGRVSFFHPQEDAEAST